MANSNPIIKQIDISGVVYDLKDANTYDKAEIGKMLSNKQNTLTGTEGQIVKFNASGEPVAENLDIIAMEIIDIICGISGGEIAEVFTIEFGEQSNYADGPAVSLAEIPYYCVSEYVPTAEQIQKCTLKIPYSESVFTFTDPITSDGYYENQTFIRFSKCDGEVINTDDYLCHLAVCTEEEDNPGVYVCFDNINDVCAGIYTADIGVTSGTISFPKV